MYYAFDPEVNIFSSNLVDLRNSPTLTQVRHVNLLWLPVLASPT